MNKLLTAFSIVPVTARVVAACMWFGMVGLFVLVADKSFPTVAAAALLLIGPAAMALYVVLVGYIFADAKRRGMRHVMWTLLAVFIPNAIGIILYFLLREPMPATCQACGTLVKGTFAFCPKCGTVLRPSCPQCQRAVETGWTACAWCGQKLG